MLAVVMSAACTQCATPGWEANWLVGEYAYNVAAKNVHYTLGGPYFEAYRDCDYADEWFAERRQMK